MANNISKSAANIPVKISRRGALCVKCKLVGSHSLHISNIWCEDDRDISINIVWPITMAVALLVHSMHIVLFTEQIGPKIKHTTFARFLFKWTLLWNVCVITHVDDGRQQWVVFFLSPNMHTIEVTTQTHDFRAYGSHTLHNRRPITRYLV